MAVHRGDVYFVDLDSAIGREQAGRRPVVVMSNDVINRQPLVITVVPGTHTRKLPMPNPWHVLVPAGEANLSQKTMFLAFQMRALDHSRFKDPPIGRLSTAVMNDIEKSLSWILSMSRP